MQHEPSAARRMLGDFAPKFADLTEDFLFGQIWEGPELAKRDRSLITVAALVSLNRTAELPLHLKRALRNGVTREELKEVIIHLAFYAGWPCTFSSLVAAKAFFEAEDASANSSGA